MCVRCPRALCLNKCLMHLLHFCVYGFEDIIVTCALRLSTVHLFLPMPQYFAWQPCPNFESLWYFVSLTHYARVLYPVCKCLVPTIFCVPCSIAAILCIPDIVSLTRLLPCLPPTCPNVSSMLCAGAQMPKCTQCVWCPKHSDTAVNLPSWMYGTQPSHLLPKCSCCPWDMWQWHQCANT